ncbi:hypothetical protein BLNAU_7519 [Blattamonas nauphoetae]|uniref:Uncharacterized protein n=1 Tax=Blattamonas nauphoetae TaxID=2049346 RepID=A0ABQ9Y1L0_9EUKA|nr:hypothetical protein BLNAU_7519 [Blattamonas nauphoetae]
MSSSADVTLCRCHPLPMSPSADVTLCRCHPLPMSLSADVILCRCHPLPMSLSADVSLCRYHPRPSSTLTSNSCSLSCFLHRLIYEMDDSDRQPSQNIEHPLLIAVHVSSVSPSAEMPVLQTEPMGSDELSAEAALFRHATCSCWERQLDGSTGPRRFSKIAAFRVQPPLFPPHTPSERDEGTHKRCPNGHTSLFDPTFEADYLSHRSIVVESWRADVTRLLGPSFQHISLSLLWSLFSDDGK